MWLGPTVWLLKILLGAGLIGGGYLWMATHHYNRGWAAYEQRQAREIADVNERRATLAATLAAERGRAEADTQAAVAAAIRSTQAHCQAVPEACGVAAAGTCALPDSVRASLNRIR